MFYLSLGITKTNSMKTIIDTLAEQSVEFKIIFVERCVRYADREFDRFEKWTSEPIEKWCERFGIPVKEIMIHRGCQVEARHLEHMSDESKSEITTKLVPDVNYNSKEAKTYRKMMDARDKTARIVKAGKQDYVSKAETNAVEYFDFTLGKLAFRLKAKGVNDGDEFEISSKTINVNFECHIRFCKVDGEFTKRLNAWTIIASGPVQKPHYRYLIK